MPDRSARKLAAILAADIAGYSALMGSDEARTVSDLKGHQAVVLPMIGGHGGRIIDTAGDGILAEFQSIVKAVECAIAIQNVMAERNAEVEPSRRMRFRIGLNLGDVIYDEARIYGDGINIAARLEGIAKPGGICISGKVYDEVSDKLGQRWESLGLHELKNIAMPVRVYAMAQGESDPPAASAPSHWRVGLLSRLFGRATHKPTARRAVSEADQVPLPAGSRPATLAPVIVHGQARAFCVLMGEDDAATRGALRTVRAALSSALTEQGGRLIQSPPDTVVAAFSEAALGVAGTIAALEGLQRMNLTAAPAERVHYRFGIVTETSGDEEARSSAIAEAAAIALQSLTEGVVISDTVRSRLPLGAAQKFVMAAPGAYAYAREGTAVGVGPAQLEGLSLPILANKPSIVNGPFVCLGDDPQGPALAEGLRLDVQNCLVKMSGLHLAGAGAANAFRDAPAVDRARRLGVRNALEATVRRNGEKVRVDVRLLDVVADKVLWSEQYDRSLDVTFHLEDEISERIVTEIEVKLTSGEQARIWRKALTQPKARQLHYEGMEAFFRMNEESISKAREKFERLAEIVKDSPHGPTWTAVCLWQEISRGWAKDRGEALKLADSWAARAVAFEDADGQAHTILGNVRLLQGRFDEAMTIAREAASRRPGCPNANGFFANVLLHCGDPAAAIVHASPFYSR